MNYYMKIFCVSNMLIMNIINLIQKKYNKTIYTHILKLFYSEEIKFDEYMNNF